MGRDDGSRVRDGGHPARLNVVGAARWNPEAQATRRWPSVWRAPARQPSSWEACWIRTERASSVTCARVWAAPRPFSFLTHSRRCRCSSNRREVPPSAPTRATAVSSPTDCLRPANVRRTVRGDPGRCPIEPSAVYAAQTTEVLLDAIARSDGSRSSVTDELFATASRTGCSAPSASTRTVTSPRARSRSCGSRAAARHARSGASRAARSSAWSARRRASSPPGGRPAGR